jgi:hypothetical protein
MREQVERHTGFGDRRTVFRGNRADARLILRTRAGRSERFTTNLLLISAGQTTVSIERVRRGRAEPTKN